MKTKIFLSLAFMAISAMGTMSAQNAEINCDENVTLETLTAYMDTVHPADERVMLFYANLINNPTHSYRIEHLDLGFNGCTGRVDEQVVMADGNISNNVFIFDEKGLMTYSLTHNSKGNPLEINYNYSYSSPLGFTLKQSKTKARTINYASLYDEKGYRVTFKGDNGRRNDYTFDEKGHLTKLIEKPAKGDTRTLLYQDGYIVREETGGKVFRYHYDFDTATGKKFLIAIKELKGSKVIHERTFDYDIDTHGRYTRVDVALDGKHQMTITRSYSD